MKHSQRPLENWLYIIGIVVLLAGSLGIYIYFKFILPYGVPIPCVLYQVFGLYCPGCGGTRAVSALLRGQLLNSLWYHPLVPYTVIIFGGFMVTQTLERLHVPKVKGWKFHPWYLYMAVVLLFANFIVKNILLIAFGITLDCI